MTASSSRERSPRPALVASSSSIALRIAAAVAAFALLAGCSDATELGRPRTDAPAGSTGSTSGGTGVGGSAGTGGAGGAAPSTAEAILAALRADRDATLLAQASETGWPVEVDDGYLFVTTRTELHLVAGDHDGWTGTEMKEDAGFRWVVLQVDAGDRYKFTDGAQFVADPWSRSYTYDDFGEMSLVAPVAARLDRHFAVGDGAMAPRTVRAWVPAEPADRVLYVHDGQGLFDPQGPWGGWHLQDSAPAGVMIVGIDNTPDRMDEYTHVADKIGGSDDWIGGKGDAYADFIRDTVRPLIRARYGEPGPVGVMGSSLGGLISFHVADHDKGAYAFAASLSGTMGWGSIGSAVHNPTMIERYAAHTDAVATLYLDSGGIGPCADGDGDGVDDDADGATDNYCENLQMRGVLSRPGSPYQEDVTLFYAWDTGAEHNEAAWSARVVVPLQIFAGL